MLKSMRDTFNESEYRPMNALVPGSRRCAMRIGIGNPRTARFLKPSEMSWAAILRDLKRRGLQAPKLVIGDGHLGIWGALAAVFPEAKEQRCWNHRILLGAKLPRPSAKTRRGSLLTKIPYAETREEAERLKRAFQAWCSKHGHADVGRTLDRDWDRMVTFYVFPREHWKHLRTSNPVESPFAAVRLRTAAAKRFKKVENATAVIWKTLLIAEKTFRRLDAPELLADVAERRGLRQRSACGEPRRRRGSPPDLIYTLLDKTST